MKSLAQLATDNRMSNRDYGGLCNYAVFHNGDFVAQFLYEEDAKEFASLYEYAHGPGVEVIEAEA
jgi:hypothetical protein